MADTIRGHFPNRICCDCGEEGTTFCHDGRLVPEGTTADLCLFCWHTRATNNANGKEVQPLGVKPPGEPEEFRTKAIIVETKSGSIYRLGIPNESGKRKVSCNVRTPEFDTCKILLLKIGEDLWLRQGDKFWQTTRVKSITPIE